MSEHESSVTKGQGIDLTRVLRSCAAISNVITSDQAIDVLCPPDVILKTVVAPELRPA